MANDNYPRVLPLNWPGNVPVHYYRVSTAADIYLGQFVQLDASGYAVGVGTNAGVVLTIGLAVGFAGPDRAGTATNDPYLDVSDLAPPAPLPTGDRYVAVTDDPSQLYVVQEDTGGTALALADNFSSVDLLFRGAGANIVNGDADSGWANLEIDASTVVQTSAAFAQLIQLHDRVNSDGTRNAVGDYAKWIVRPLHHSYRWSANAAGMPVV